MRLLRLSRLRQVSVVDSAFQRQRIGELVQIGRCRKEVTQEFDKLFGRRDVRWPHLQVMPVQVLYVGAVLEI